MSTTLPGAENSLMHNNTLRMSADCCAISSSTALNRAQPQRADVDSRKIASLKGDRVQKEVRPASSCMNETLPRSTSKTLGWDSPNFFLRYGVRFSTVLVPQLQL
jgi:hypothetical protein